MSNYIDKEKLGVITLKQIQNIQYGHNIKGTKGFRRDEKFLRVSEILYLFHKEQLNYGYVEIEEFLEALKIYKRKIGE